MRSLCLLADLPSGVAMGFAPAEGAHYGLFAVHGPNGPVVYVNACPHLGVPLDWLPGRFLSPDGSLIVCATHGAEFRIDTGQCLRGPCRGEALTLGPSTVVDGTLMVAADAGR
jgi:nitrite reductase/ring-hydroxylating ferredoxin subunit